MSEPRHSGMTFSEFAAHMDTMINDHGYVRPDMTADVPCGTCTVCCHHDRVEVVPWEFEHLPYLITEPDPEGIHPESRKLKRHDDGSCIHLLDQGNGMGCTVYEHRPMACRVYDCRYTNFLGLTVSYGGRTEPTWVFDITTQEDAAIAATRAEIAQEIAGMTNSEDDVQHAQRRMAQCRKS